MANPRTDFQLALLTDRVAARAIHIAMEHDSPEALNKYLQEHPDADKSKHTVKSEAPKGEPKAEPKAEPKGEPAAEPKSESKGKGKGKSEAKPTKEDKPKARPSAIKVHKDTVKVLEKMYTQKTNDHNLGGWGGNNNPLRDLIHHAGKGGAVGKADVDKALDFLKKQRAGEGRGSAREKLDEVKRQLEHVRKHF